MAYQWTGLIDSKICDNRTYMCEEMEQSNKAVIVSAFNQNAVKVDENKLPELDGRLEVNVCYSGINFVDLYTLRGILMQKLPLVLGVECCGTITKLGIESDEFKVGQRVICYDYLGGMHSYTVRVNPEQCFVIPDDFEFDVGAAVFVNYITGYFAVKEIGNLREGQSVFIQGCAGGVGWAATQLAKLVPNTKVYGTSSTSKTPFVMENGVTKVFSYEKLYEQLDKLRFDVIIDNQGGEHTNALLGYLKHLGKYIVIGTNDVIMGGSGVQANKFQPAELIYGNRVAAGLHIGTLLENEPLKVKKALGEIIGWIKEGKLKPRIDKVYSVADVNEALKFLSDRKNVGKVLLKY